MPKSKLVELYGSCIFSFFKKQPKCFPEWLFHFTFLPVLCKQFSFKHPHQNLVLSLFFKTFIYFWLSWVFVAALRFPLVVASGGYSSCGVRASHCSGFSCCRARALGMQASVVVAHGLSCPEACAISLDQGSNLCPLSWQVDS